MKAPPKRPNGRDEGAELDRLGLLWLHLFRWLRPADLGALMYPDNPEYAARGSRLVRKWRDAKWVIERELETSEAVLPDKKPNTIRAVLLSKKGAEHLASLFDNRLEPPPRSGADWGDQASSTDLDLPRGSPSANLLNALLMGDEEVVGELPDLRRAQREEAPAVVFGEEESEPEPKRKRKGTHIWEPPQTWIHDLRASSFAAVIRRKYPNWTIVPERQLRTGGPEPVPDLLLIAPDWPDGDGTCEKMFWVEIEHAKKSGKLLRDMAHTLIDVALNGRRIGSRYEATDALLAFAPLDVNNQGHLCKHESRVREAIKKQAHRDVPLTVVTLHIDIVTKAVVDADFRMVELASDPEALELAKLEWEQDDHGVHRAEWHRRPGVFLEVSKAKDGSGWEWRVWEYRKNQQQEVDEGFARNMTEAKKAALHCAQGNFMH